MNIEEVSADEFDCRACCSHIYNRAAFSELNKHKAERLHYLLFADKKVRFSITLGERADGLYSPFSAPFGGFNMKEPQPLGFMEEAVSLLKEWREPSGMPIMITLQPLVYGETQLSKWVSVMQRGGRMHTLDLNYHFQLSRFEGYEQHIYRNARKNLHQAMRQSFTFTRLNADLDSDVARAYSVIKQNREEHGYPLRMTLEEVLKTRKIIPADFFVASINGDDVAAAQVFRVTEDTAQVVYWGHLQSYSELRPMNFLTYNVFAHYHRLGMKTLDIGPSTEDGIPNHGLCDFKEAIGCSVSPKFRFVL